MGMKTNWVKFCWTEIFCHNYHTEKEVWSANFWQFTWLLIVLVGEHMTRLTCYRHFFTLSDSLSYRFRLISVFANSTLLEYCCITGLLCDCCCRCFLRLAQYLLMLWPYSILRMFCGGNWAFSPFSTYISNLMSLWWVLYFYIVVSLEVLLNAAIIIS